MSFSVLDALTLIGALGFFIYGMKIMSEGIQKIAGNKMREILRVMTANRFFGLFTGFLITSIVQSSSASTVMTVSFVNAGLLSLTESIGVIMGANIGTTITGWLVSIFGFKVKIAAIALPIIAIGTPLLFSSKSKTKSWGEFLIGFALLFMGLEALKNAVPDLKGNPEILSFLSNYADTSLPSLMLFIGIGTLLTVIVQSSSAAMALTLVMCNEGWIPFEMAAGMILGENIGTTITANLAALVGNVHAKRAARAHLLFNIIGVIWMLFAYKFFVSGIDSYMVREYNSSPLNEPTSIPIALSIFHSTFNIVNVLLLIWFVPQIARLVEKMVPSKGNVDEQFHLEYIGSGVMSTPELSLMEAKKEVAKFAKLTLKMKGFVQQLLSDPDAKSSRELLARIKKYEDITDNIEAEVVEYLSKVSEGKLSEDTSNLVRAMMRIVGELEMIGDVLYQMSKTLERKIEDKMYIMPEQRDKIVELLTKVEEAMTLMIENLQSDYDQVSITKARELEDQINLMRDDIRREHYKNIESGDYNVKIGMIYADLYSACEKIGDHVMNVTESITGED